MASYTPSHGSEAAAASSHARGTPGVAVAVGGAVRAVGARRTADQRDWSQIASPREKVSPASVARVRACVVASVRQCAYVGASACQCACADASVCAYADASACLSKMASKGGACQSSVQLPVADRLSLRNSCCMYKKGKLVQFDR